MAKRTNDIRRWALIGAEQRLVQLAEEIATIHDAFPELRQGRRGSRAGSKAAPPAAPKRRRRRKLSAEARKRISEAQKARWAKQKSGKK